MHATTNMLFEVKDLEVTYLQGDQREPVLKDVSFYMEQNETVALLGQSGSGKSTLAKAMTGMLPHSARVTSGSLTIGTEQVANLTDTSTPWQRIRGRRIAMLYQDPRQALNPLMKIKDNFRELLQDHQLASSRDYLQISEQWLYALNFQDAKRVLECYPFQLSGGMCQRVCLALALCLKPSVLIADEPTSALDIVNQREVLDVLKTVQKQYGLTLLMITHDLAVANSIGDRVLILNKGKIVEEGNTKKVFSKPQDSYTKQLLSARSLLSESPQRKSVSFQSKQKLLEIKGLEKQFQQKQVLTNIDLTLHRHEIMGILGQSGCGKSTLARCVMGLETINSGQMMYKGTDLSKLNNKKRRAMSKHIQLVFQEARGSLHPGRTALQIVMEPLHYLHLGNRKERQSLAEAFLKEVGISSDMHARKPPQLSTGQCQRIAIARALVLRPEVLICDEAVSALDMHVQAQILKLLQQLHQKFEFAILMISHDIRVLRSFCHTIAVIDQGRFCEVRPANALEKESKNAYTKKLFHSALEMEKGLSL
ncbi:ABC transporter ATP-binding protein [Saliterribacillus persicus]|uniref:Peptide/nickel transport system ATP-binding protein n=1 Tax=Saliterribacillus persicus TaxID=930114 RepID=A0A368Y9S9_9BACI|nr:ABC transporter ATP-binding protein [Saliterribacillus persicus]RCW77021.1 peptide/nickel transport system ATP-binding protein [Saliterribacillus persicus]